MTSTCPELYYPRKNGDKPPQVFTAHLPTTFDPSVVEPKDVVYACWVVSAVVIRRFIDRGADDSTFVPLDSRYIEGHIPAKVRRPLLDRLLEAQVLECDNVYYFKRYFDGGPGKCFCYRLGEGHRGAPIRPHHVTHCELLRKANVFHQREREAITDPVHRALRHWHDQVDVLLTAPQGEHPLLDRLINGERRFKVCDQGRVHTNVANLPRQYRQFLRVNGRELVSCDISTSQPLLLGVLLRKSRADGGREGEHTRTLPEAVFNPSSNSSLNVFLADCLNGTVYDRIVSATGYSRDDVKSMFLAVIYGHPDHMNTKVGLAIRDLYPDVFNAVVELNHELGHGGLPCLMQQQESRVMIGRVAARLLRENPSMPLLTVHDSVLVPEEFASAATKVIREEWQTEFGVVPNVKTSEFMAPQEPRPKQRRRRRKNYVRPSRGFGRAPASEELLPYLAC
jgi:hypothetical protein